MIHLSLGSVFPFDFQEIRRFWVLGFTTMLGGGRFLLLSAAVLELSFVVIYVPAGSENCFLVLLEALDVLLQTISISFHKDTID